LRNVLVAVAAMVVLAGLGVGGWYGYSKFKFHKFPPGLVALWSGDGNDADSVSGNDGHLINGAGYAPGKAGQAFSLSGNAYVEVSSSPAITPTGAFTVMAWVNYTRTSGTYASVPVVGKGQDAPTAIDWFLGISPNRRLRPHINVSGNWVYYDCDTTLASSAWHHVAMVYDGKTLCGYVNGVLDGSKSVSGTLQATDNPLRIGAYAPVNGGQGGSFCLQGQIGEVAIYNRALSASEIQAIYIEQK
jgi:hypothetical protein